MVVRIGPKGRLSSQELMLLNGGAGENSQVPWTARRSNQSILKEINPEYSLEGLMLKLKLQSSDHLVMMSQLTGKYSDVGKTEGKMRREWQRMRWLDSIAASVDMILSKL